jgi:tetratricopeptide (TPR) repeat protein
MALDLRTVTNPAVASLQQGNTQNRLGADYFVQGSLNSARGGVLVRARMTDASGFVVWEDETVRDLGDPVEARTVQAEIAGHIAAALGTTLTGIDYCEPSADGEAVAAYYEGWRLYNQRSAEGIAAAARALEEAIEIDPDYARALTELASVYQRFGFWLAEDPPPPPEDRTAFESFLDEAPAKIVDLSERALTRCPNLGVAYLNAEFGQPVRRTTADVRAVYDEALRREPDNGTLLNDAINFARTYGHIELATEYAKRAFRKDPLNARAAHMLSGQLSREGDIEGSIEMELEARDLGYSARIANVFLALDYARLADAEGLDRHVAEAWPDGFVANVIMPFDPRRFVAAHDDTAARSALIADALGQAAR